MNDKFQWFNGIKFTRDDKTGYYLNSTIRKRMHRYVWEFYNGEIPDKYQIHHKDKDKSNNDISNLECIPRSKHATLHGKERAIDKYDKMIENLNENARPKASEWHKSVEGREWHKKHYENMKEQLHSREDRKCVFCGNYFSALKRKKDKYCSNKCKSAHRRASGVDNEERKCICCGEMFVVNKYSKTKTCSRNCARVISWENRREKEKEKEE